MYLNNKQISTDAETLRQKAIEFSQKGTEFMLIYGDFEKAMEYFCNAIKTDFSCAAAYLGRGYVRQFSQKPDIAKAIKDYEKALEYSDTVSDTVTYLDALKLKAFAQLSAGNHTMAGQNFKSLLMIGCTDDPEVYYGLGEAARARGDQAAAKKFFSKVLELDKYFIEKSNNIGHDLYIKTKRFREAIHYTTFAVNIILTLFPEEKQMIFACCSNLVNMYADVGEREKANAYKKIVMNTVSTSDPSFDEKDELPRD